MKPVELAVMWAKRRVPCFPIAIAWDATKGSTNKRPLTNHGHKDATTDIHELSGLFDSARLRTGESVAVGLYPGPAGLVVFDIDRKGGLDGFEAADNLGLRDSFAVSTASGGEHRYFKLPEGVRVGNKSPWAGIDIRSADGWIVAPGVETPWGNWEPLPDHSWPDDLDDIPNTVLELLDQRVRQTAGIETAGDEVNRSVTDESTEAALAACISLGARVHRRVLFKGRETYEIIRPGKDYGVSATVGYVAPGIVNVFSSEWEGFPPGGYTERDGKLLNYAEEDVASMEVWIARCGEPPVDQSGNALKKGGRRAPSQATQIVEIACRQYKLATDQNREAIAIEIARPNVAWSISGAKFGLAPRLAKAFLAEYGAVIPKSAISDALLTLEGIAADGPTIDVHLRVGRAPTGDIVLDLGHPDGNVVVISQSGWYVSDRSPICFRRTGLTSPIPVPIHGGNLIVLRGLMNVSDRQWGLILGWMVAAYFPEIPHPILALLGEHGTAKSTAASMIVRIIDPSGAPTATAPSNVDEWIVTAAGSWLVPLDNISSLQGWLSDSLCKAVTGDGLRRRTLYTNSDITVHYFRRCLIMTSIDIGAIRGDLADRLLKIELERISGANRRADTEVEALFEANRATILGGLLDLLVKVLAVFPEIALPEMSRMADYTKVLAALDDVQDTNILANYIRLSDDLAFDVIDGDAVAAAILEFMKTKGTWTGNAAALLEATTPPIQPKGWPQSPKALAGRITRCLPALRANGVDRESGPRRTFILTYKPPSP